MKLKPIALIIAVVATAATASLTPPAASTSAKSETAEYATTDGQKVEQAFDKAFARDGKFAFTGAVVTVVQDGKIVLSKGYGFADARGNKSVDPVTTRFRLASVTKTLTGTGIGLLIDQGKISSLASPANEFLTRYKIPNNAGHAITLRMLGTHQAGFAEIRQPFQRGGIPTKLVDAAYLRENFPGYVQPVNAGSNYSNVGASLLGKVIEDQSGQSYSAFIEREIFAPTGMIHSLIQRDARPVANLAEAQSFYPNGGVRTIPDNWAQNEYVIESGALVSTGNDMARYMISLLGGSSELLIPSLLSDKGKAAVFSRQGGTHPMSQGFGVLFMINNWNGEKLIEHGGRTLGTSSYLILMPERRTGIFVSVTGEFGSALPAAELLGLPDAPAAVPERAGKMPPGLSHIRAIAVEALLGRYRVPGVPSASPVMFDANEYSGQYIGQRRSLRSVTQLFSDSFLGGPLTIKGDGKRGLILGSTPYVPIAKDVFWHDPTLTPERPSGWSDLLIFRRGADGKVKDASLLYTDVVYAKASGILTPTRAIWALVLGGLVLLTGLLSFLWAKDSKGRILAPFAATAFITTPIAFFRSWPAAPVESLSYTLISSSDLILFQLWLNGTALLAATIILVAVRSVLMPDRSIGWRSTLARWHLRLLATGAISLITAYFYYNMIGWNIR